MHSSCLRVFHPLDFERALRKRVIIIVFEEVMPRHVGESRTPTCSSARVRA
eukprot:SAG11_NODE_14663_length_604_cov_0.718812_1_plen_50_part_01